MSLADLSDEIDRTVADLAPEENLLREHPQRLVRRARLDSGFSRVRSVLAHRQGLPRAGVKDSRHERFDTEDRDDHDDRHNHPGPGAGRHRAVSGSGTMPLRPAASTTRVRGSGGWILPPGPGDGWGFPNNNPDGYGWSDPGPFLPLGADRTAEYYFRAISRCPSTRRSWERTTIRT